MGKKIIAGHNDLASCCPDLLKEWDYNKNPVSPTEVGYRSGEKAWWKCERGHSWEAVICNRTSRRDGCPYCAGRVAIKGVNDIATLYPTLVEEWDFEKNGDLSPQDFVLGSGKKVWWKCKNGHEWQAAIGNRTIHHSGCPYCAGKKAIKGINDITTLYPSLVEEWDFKKNGNLSPKDFMPGSDKKVWWKCNKGHEWQARIANRTIKQYGCPYCSGKKSIAGETDIEALYPDLIKEWNFAKNDGLSPRSFTPGSEKKVWWTCPHGHDYFATICGRVKRTGCPYCSGRQAIKGVNDLLTMRPDVAEEWDYEKNGSWTPEETTVASGVKVWWKCSLCGHSWKTTPAMRTGQNTGCPNCIKHRRTSFPEQAIFYYVQKIFPDAINSYTDIFSNTMELDIYVPSIKTGIEYDGVYWHKNEKREQKKYEICKEKGIKLIRVKEDYSGIAYVATACDHMILRKTGDDAELNVCIKTIIDLLGHSPIDIDVCTDRPMIKSNYIVSFKSNSLAAKYPSIAAEWDYEKNIKLTPEMVTPHSGDKVWWKCPSCGKSYYNSPDRRIGRGNGCPYCSGRNAITGVNDFTITRPEVAAEWNYEKNNDLLPSEFKSGSDKEVWWICKKGHEWQEKIYKRAHRGYGCPYCSGQRINSGENDFATLFPEIAKEWNYLKNKDINPCSLSPHSEKKVWWVCKKGHEWEANISSKTGKDKTGCPICSGRKVLQGFNDLECLRPDIAAKWNYKKNIELKPSEVYVHSNERVWWICNRGHEWEAPINKMVSAKINYCPYCTNRIILAGFNDLKTTNPDIAIEWDETKNKDLKPTEVGKGSSHKAWWKCRSCGYSWQAVISSRTGKQACGCPKCAIEKRYHSK